MVDNTVLRLGAVFWGVMFLVTGILLMVSDPGYMMNLIGSLLWDLWPVLFIAQSDLIWNA